jgi:putative oxidoreductase
VTVDAALLVLRLVPGLLLIGHGMQKLVPPSYAPPALHAIGVRATARAFEGLGIRPGLPSAIFAGTAEILGGFSLAAGLLTPVGTALVVGVMTTAILSAQLRNGIWAAEGGFEYTLSLAATAFVVTALGPGAYSINSWLNIDNWAGLDTSMGDAARAAIVVAIGAAGGLLPLIAAAGAKRFHRLSTVRHD